VNALKHKTPRRLRIWYDITPKTKPATTAQGFCLGVSSTRTQKPLKSQMLSFIRKVKLKDPQGKIKKCI